MHAQPASATVMVSGEVDHYTAPRLSAVGVWLFVYHDCDVTMSFQDVTFVDSGIVVALEALQQAAAATGRHLRLSDVPPRVVRVFGLAGAADLLTT